MQADYLKGEFLPKRRTKRQAAVSLRRWANNIVYFFFDSSVSEFHPNSGNILIR